MTTSGASGTDAKSSVSVGGLIFGSEAILQLEQREYVFNGSASGKIILKWKATQVATLWNIRKKTKEDNSEGLSFYIPLPCIKKIYKLRHRM